MSFRITNFTSNPPSQKAGKAFTLTVYIDPVQNVDVMVTLEKQRLVSNGTTPELRPTGADYFVSSFEDVLKCCQTVLASSPAPDNCRRMKMPMDQRHM